MTGPFVRPVLLVLLSAGVLSCSHLKLGRELEMSDHDWPTYGRDPGRSNMTAETVKPPLAVKWKRDVTGGIGNGSPVIVDSLLVIGTLRGELHVYNIRNGEREGWLSLGESIQGSPSVHGEIAYVAISNSDESLLAYNMRTGKHLWAGRYGDIEVSPLLSGGRLFAGNVAGEFYCVDIEDGSQVWKFEVSDNNQMKGIRSSPALSDSTVVFGCEDHFVYALDTRTGTLRWRSDAGAPVVSPPSIRNGVVYATDAGGFVRAIGLESGNLLWQADLGSPLYAGPAIAGPHLYVATSRGSLFALDAANGREVWRTELGAVVNTPPVIAGPYLYIGTLRKILYGIDTATGTILLQEVLDGRVKTAAAVAFGTLFVATDDRWIIAFGERREK